MGKKYSEKKIKKGDKRDLLTKSRKFTTKSLTLYLIPLLLTALIAMLIGYDADIRYKTSKLTLKPITESVTLTDYPLPLRPIQPFVTAQAAIIMDNDSKVVLYKKNARLRFSMASTTKIMTALVGIDYYKPDDILTVKSPYVEGTKVGFFLGEQLYFNDLLFAMLLPSGNDAAYAVADNYPGGMSAFVGKLNEKARSLHLLDTHYSDPAGLQDDGDFTTVVDLARLTSHALANPTISRIVGTKSRLITSVDGRNTYPLSNLNKLLGIDGVTGVKTGTTIGAGEVLITSKVEKGHTFIIIVMGSQDRFADTETLISYLTNNISFIQPTMLSGRNPL